MNTYYQADLLTRSFDQIFRRSEREVEKATRNSILLTRLSLPVENIFIRGNLDAIICFCWVGISPII